MTDTREKQPLRPLMKQVKDLWAEWRLANEYVKPHDKVTPPSNNYPPYTKADGTKGTRIHLGFVTAEPPVDAKQLRLFAKWLRKHPEFDGTVIYKEFPEGAKKSHRYLLIEPAEASDTPVAHKAPEVTEVTEENEEDDGRAVRLFGTYPKLSHNLPAPTQFLRR